MNYSKKSTSRKQKALKSRKSKMGKKLGVVFLKTLLVLFIAVGVAGLCGGIGIVKGVIENAPDINGQPSRHPGAPCAAGGDRRPAKLGL